MNLMKRLWKEEEGQGMVEYVVILGLIVAIAIALFTTGLGDAIQNKIDAITNSLA